MRTGRPVNENTIYKVSIHVNGKHRYASTQPNTLIYNNISYNANIRKKKLALLRQ